MAARLRVLSFVLLLGLGFQSPAAAQLSPARDPSGSWAGSAQLSSPCRGESPCRGKMQPPSIRLDGIRIEGSTIVEGYLSIRIPSAPGCPGVDITRMAISGAVSATRVTIEAAGRRDRRQRRRSCISGRLPLSRGSAARHSSVQRRPALRGDHPG